MTYMQAIAKLKSTPDGVSGAGSTAPNLIRRKAWEDEKIMVLTNEQTHIAIARTNTSTKRHMEPEVQRVVTSCEDLWSNDWELVEAKDYF